MILLRKALETGGEEMSSIIQFYHTWVEHLVDYDCFDCGYKCLESKESRCRKKLRMILTDGIMPWNDLKNHKRKFIKARGKYIYNGNNSKVESDIQDIALWGEFEPPTSFEEIKYTFELGKKDLNNYPKFIHTPRIIENIDAKNLQNTDPYVYGQSFLYSCCLQSGFKILHNLNRGDIILFGSRGKKDGKYYFALDTVFVVDKLIATFNRKNYKNLIKDKIISETYFYSVIDKIFNGNRGSLDDTAENESNMAGCINNEDLFDFHLYSSVTYKTPYNGMYSFFPCKKYEGNIEKSAFVRIELPYEKFALSKPGKNTGINQTVLNDFTRLNRMDRYSREDILKIYWDMLVEEVFKNDCCLGVYAEEPRMANFI